MFFEARGSPHYCWCTVWRTVEAKGKVEKADKKRTLRKEVLNGVPVGLLAYHDDVPVAWCSVAPRETFRSLGGDMTLEDVWSIVCFFVQRPFRRQGVSAQLITAAVKHARRNGAKFVEAYPVATDSPSYRFMGYVPSFANAGFEPTVTAGKRRQVMVLRLY